ncbi:hypothetical protein MKX03_026350 [Papaver bracteatum]|nr:hypothetical protein MKX03_026350 [Papaver bracteatum]
MAAIENLAGMDVLCSDKTGALTLSKLQFDVSTTWALHLADKVPYNGLIRAASMSFQYEDPDATDKSIYEMLDDEWKGKRAAIPELHFVPYDPINKLAVMTYINGAETLQVSKGAPEKILKLDLMGDKSVIEYSIHAKMDEYAKRGLRAHAVAYQKVLKGMKENHGGSWRFLGLLPIKDFARPGSAESIKSALELGVTVKMITGDELKIANHTGEVLGLRTSIHPSSSLFGHNKDDVLAVLSFRNMIEKTDVFAGVTPELKYEIVKRFQSIKHICGVTGAELNDVPALEKADIGIAIFDATDAARRASDIFLTEGGLNVIVNAVLTSRAVFRRMKCYTIYAVSITTLTVLGFTLLALVWRFSFPLILVLIIAILNDVLVMTIARDDVKPSPQPDSWRLSEIFTMGVVLGCYLAGMTVLFFWTASRTNFFPVCDLVLSLPRDYVFFDTDFCLLKILEILRHFKSTRYRAG